MTAEVLATGLYRVPVEALSPAPDNPRQELGDIEELTASLIAIGQLQPCIVTPSGMVVAGHRRHAAAMAAGFATLLCDVRELTESQRREAMVTENLQRVDLTVVEEAHGYQLLLDVPGSDQTDVDHIAKRTGMRVQRVRDRLELLRLPHELLAELHAGRLTIAEAQLLSKVSPDILVELVQDAREAADEGEAFQFVNWKIKEAIELSERRDKVAAITAQLEAQGVPITEWHGVWKHNYKPNVFVGERYVSPPTKSIDIAVAAHRKAPCRVVAVDEHGAVHELCSDPKSHAAEIKARAAKKEKASPRGYVEPEKTVAELREPERLAKLREILAGDCSDGDTLGWAVQQMVRTWDEELYFVRADVAKVLEVAVGELEALAGKAPGRVLVASMAAVFEQDLADQWRHDSLRPYFEWLQLHGYQPAEGELESAGVEVAST